MPDVIATIHGMALFFAHYYFEVSMEAHGLIQEGGELDADGKSKLHVLALEGSKGGHDNRVS